MFRGVLLLALCGLAASNEACFKNGKLHKCVSLDSCASAKEQLKNNIEPTYCWQWGTDQVVCCLDHLSYTSTKVVKWKEVNANDDDIEASCPPVSENSNVSKTGRKAWDMCLEYQETLYPCVKTPGLVAEGNMTRTSHCILNAAGLVVGGAEAIANEYPHMVMLGYVTDNILYWACGGSLISDQFVLTAGHCIASSIYGQVTYVYVGALRKSEATDSKNLYTIKRIHKHPDYRSPRKYNDIALLELVKRVKLSASVLPACLPVGHDYNDYKVKATGWGLTAYKGAQSDVLQKVDLIKFATDECEDFFPPGTRYFERGLDVDTQMCYGDKEKSKDTCEGDSGGPLQIWHPQIHCMYIVVGITSGGFVCGVRGQPAMYTRVAHYVPWIESVVWP